MKTYPIIKKQNKISSFEISSAWLSFRPLYKLLRSCKGVTDIKRNWFNEDRISFKYNDIECAINEQHSDNSRYSIGPKTDIEIDLSELHKIFMDYHMLFTFDKEFKKT